MACGTVTHIRQPTNTLINMLQPKQPVPYIGVFKLQTGEEFIGKVVEETMTSITVIKPLTVVNTQQGAQFVPVMFMVDQDKPVIFPKPLIKGEPSEAVVTQYESLISGIALPAKQGILMA